MWPSPLMTFENTAPSETVLQLLMFVDQSATAAEQIQQVKSYLETLGPEYPFELRVLEVSQHPELVEYFKLVVTPALVRIYPEPLQVLAGTDLVSQLRDCWLHWQPMLLDAVQRNRSDVRSASQPSLAHFVQLMQLSDELFRLKQENEALRNQLHFKDCTIDMLAHDLRNPLTAATIALETLDNQWDPKQQPETPLKPKIQQRLTHHARTHIQMIERMITHLLETSRGKSAELQICPKRLDLASLCQDVVANIQGWFKAKSQHLQTDIPPDLPEVHADADRIRQVIMNLLENASKYTPGGGKIQLSVLHRTTQKVQISVCDNGLGIPEEQQVLIFDNQFRLSRDQSQEGYGIGLALCQQLVQAHYGRIWVDSTPNQGSCFHFTLPVYRS